MFIISITYQVELEKVDLFMTEHIDFLNRYYEQGVFIASGRKIPRTGGVILARTGNLESLKALLEEDPFYREQLADFTITEFAVSQTAEGFDALKEQ